MVAVISPWEGTLTPGMEAAREIDSDTDIPAQSGTARERESEIYIAAKGEGPQAFKV